MVIFFKAESLNTKYAVKCTTKYISAVMFDRRKDDSFNLPEQQIDKYIKRNRGVYFPEQRTEMIFEKLGKKTNNETWELTINCSLI